MMREIRKDYDNREDFVLILDWNFFDSVRQEEDIDDCTILSNIVKDLKEGDSLILSSDNKERSEASVEQLEEESKKEVRNITIHDEGYYINPEIFQEEESIYNPETLG